jgi:biopolymer transport protein ExbD
MKPTYSRKTLSAINITPLVDVLLILLVILMLAMPMFVKRLPVDLPQTSLGGAPTLTHSLTVSLNAAGKLFVDNNPTTLEQLKTKIDATVSVELSVDKDTTYDKIAGVITELQGKGPKDISLMTR